MKILIIGGSGFLGSYVADELFRKGHKVILFDKKKSKRANKKIKIIIGDIQNHFILKKAIKGVDVVYNFAAISDLDESLTKPIETVKINVLGNVLVLNACQQAEVQRYVTDLRSITQGRGVFSLKYLRHEQVPSHLSQSVIDASKSDSKEV